MATIARNIPEDLPAARGMRQPFPGTARREGWWLPVGLRGRLLLLCVVMFVAGAGLTGWVAVERYAAAEAEVAKDTLHLTQLAAHELERLIEGERHLLNLLAKVPAIRNLDVRASGALLAAVRYELPIYANFSLFDADGEAIASAIPLRRPVNSADLPWFQRALQTRGFAVGEFQVGRISDKPVLVAAYPILDDAGQIVAVLNAALDMTSVTAVIKPVQLQPEATLTVIDRKGTVLARHPEPDKWVGLTLPAADNIKAILSHRQGTAEVAGLDGVKRIYSFMPASGSDEGLFVSIGISKQAASGAIRRAFIRELSALGLAAGLAVLVVFLLATASVVRPVNALVAVARRLAGGDLSARAGAPYGKGELEQLRHAFDEMASALEAREDERRRVVEELRKGDSVLRLFVEHSPAAIAMFDHEMKYIVASRRYRLDYDLGDQNLPGHSHYEVFPEIPERWKEIHRRCLAGATERSEDDLFPRADGRVDWVRWEIRPWYEANGRVGGVILLSEVITERKQAEVSLRDSNEQLHTLSRRLLDIQETERRALARELHDEIGQSLTAIKIHLQGVQRFAKPEDVSSQLADSVALVDRALHNARALALNLRPPLLDDLGLIPSLRWLADQQTLHTGLLMTFTAGTPEQRLDPAVEISCFRITQEALNNVVKHARARTVTVDLTQDTGFLRVRVRDDGCGFDQAEALHGARSGASFGLIGMEERATLLGGGIEWHSTPGQGTEVHFWLPLTRV